ncbi:50S ribosomal protein L32 [Rheinheimera sp. KL1]
MGHSLFTIFSCADCGELIRYHRICPFCFVSA